MMAIMSQDFADLLVKIIDRYGEWERHAEGCDCCSGFAALPIRTANMDPCPLGRRLIQSLLAVMRQGL